MSGFDCLGAESVGFDYSALFKVAGGLLEGGGSMLEQKQAGDKATTDSATKLDAAITADRDASNAATKADVSAQLRSKSAKADADAADKASAAQDKAGADLSPDDIQKRADAADKMLATATKSAKAKPNDGYKAALVKAWTATVDKIHSQGGSDGGDKGKKDKGEKDQESWFSRPVLGPLSGSMVLAVGAAGVVVLGLVVKKIVSR